MLSRDTEFAFELRQQRGVTVSWPGDYNRVIITVSPVPTPKNYHWKAHNV